MKIMKTAFLASSTISSESVLRCYDWATELPRHVVVVSGFQSKIEKDVLHLLLKTSHTAIMALGRTTYKKIPDHLAEPLRNGQLEFISTSNQSRHTKESSYNRNKKIIDMCDEVVFGTLHPDSSLYPLYEYAKELNKPTVIL